MYIAAQLVGLYDNNTINGLYQFFTYSCPRIQYKLISIVSDYPGPYFDRS